MSGLNIDFFRAIQGSTDSPSKTETKRRKAVDHISRDYENSLDVDTFIFWDKQLTDRKIRLNILNKKHSTVIGQQEEFTCLIENSVQVGDILYNPKENIYWLTEYVVQKDYLYNTGKLYRCNGFLKWQDDEGNIWEYPVHDTNSTQYNTGLEEGRTVTYETAQHKLCTVADENTINLEVDKRFLLGKKNAKIPEAWRLTQNDTTSLAYDRGIVSLTMYRSQFNPNTDDKELWLCDVKTEPNPIGTIDIGYNGKPNVRLGTSNKTFIAETTDDIAVWEVIGEPIVALNVVANQDAEDLNKCKINCQLNSVLIGKTFTLKCTSVNGATGQITVNITGGV